MHKVYCVARHPHMRYLYIVSFLGGLCGDVSRAQSVGTTYIATARRRRRIPTKSDF